MQIWAQVSTRGADLSLRDVTIAQMGNGARESNWRHVPEAHEEDFGGFEKVRRVENLTPNEKGRLSGLAEARRICALRAPHEMVGSRCKNQNRKNVYLFPYVEEPLNSKVNKSFVPELRSRYVFFVFRDSYVLCIYVTNILCTFHISVSWEWYREWAQEFRNRKEKVILTWQLISHSWLTHIFIQKIEG